MNHTRKAIKYVTPEESAELNRRIAKLMESRRSGAVFTWVDVAKDLGISHDSVMTRLTRIRRGQAMMHLPPPKCDCDLNGPCLDCFQKKQVSR